MLTTLSEIIEIKNGKNQKDVEKENGQYPIYGSGGVIGRATEYICPPNTVVIGRKGSINNPIFVEEPFWNVDTAFGLVANEAYLLPKYLFFFCKQYDFERLNTTVTIPSLTKANINSIRIKLPSLAEQTRIVQKLEKTCLLIDSYHRELGCLNELIKSRFVEMFGDPITNTKSLKTKELKDVMILKAGDFTAASDISSIPSGDNIYPCYGGNGIRGYVAQFNQEGDYSLIGRQGALSGNVQYAKGKFRNTEHALLVTPICEMNSVWLNQLLIILDLKRYQTGAAQPGLSVKNLQEIPIIIVSLDEQEKYASFIECVDKSKLAQVIYLR